MNMPGSADPLVRAATLLHTPGSLMLATVEEPEPEPVAIACRWNRSLVTLLPPGPVAELLRARPDLVCAGGMTRTPVPGGSPCERAALHFGGAARAAAAHERREAALALWDVAAREELLDADREGGWLIAVLDVGEAEWSLPTLRLPLPVDKLWDADIDEVLRWSPRLSAQLNTKHPEVALRLAGRPAWLVEMDRDGAVLGVPGPQQFVRVAWPRPCHNLHDLHHVVAEYATEDCCHGRPAGATESTA
jgi:hypothetical protein